MGRLIVAIAFAAVASPAHAYRTFADDPAVAYPARWQSPVLWEVVDRIPSGQPDGRALLQAARAAMNAWTTTSCISVTVGEGTTTRSALQAEDGRTAIGFVEDWSGAGYRENQGAITDLRLVRAPGGEVSILEADILLNAQDFVFVEGAPGEGELDLQAVLTHEMGHLFGLLHPCETTATADGAPLCVEEDRQSTLFPDYQGLANRTLGEDDIAGACFLYNEERACGMTCPAGYACSAGQCVDPTCGLPTCPNSCDDTLCTEGECPEVEECTDGQACVVIGTNRGQCSEPGADGTRCQRGEECASNLCLTTMGLGLYCTRECRDDTQCPGQQRCVEAEGRQVCAPLPSSEGCSIAPSVHHRTSPAVFPLLVLATWLLWGARRSRKS